MSHYRMIVMFSLTALFLSSCTPEFLRRTPKIEPVHNRTSIAGFAELEIDASTNCAVPGETIAFTIHIVNRSTQPMTIQRIPALDIVLGPGAWPFAGAMPMRHWSRSPDYPTIDPVLAPGEDREYTWRWTVDAEYSQDGVKGVAANIETALQTPDMPSAQGLGIGVGVNITSMNGGEAGGPRCVDMQR